jgi:aspartate/methionine/tyrosine aminotransferase
VSSWDLKYEDGSWSVNLQELEDLIYENTKLIVVNIPQNPTGYLLTKEE